MRAFVKGCYQFQMCFWMVSPALHFLARFAGTFNYRHDTELFVFFSVMSLAASAWMFKTWDD